MRIYLIRHGQSYINLPEWKPKMRADVDLELTELGHKQAQALAEWMPHELPAFDALYSSTMLRAYQTAEYVAEAYQMEIIPETRLREFGNNHGNHEPILLEGTVGKWDPAPQPFFPYTSIIPEDDAETFMHFRTRLGNFFSELIRNHKDETVVLVAHGGVVSAVMDNIFNVGPHRFCDVWTPNTGITHIEYRGHEHEHFWRLHYQGRIEHFVKIKS